VTDANENRGNNGNGINGSSKMGNGNNGNDLHFTQVRPAISLVCTTGMFKIQKKIFSSGLTELAAGRTCVKQQTLEVKYYIFIMPSIK